MTVYELPRYGVHCDSCGATTTQHTEYGTPRGWSRECIETHDCGLTGYTRRDFKHYCPSCPRVLPTLTGEEA